MCVRNEKCYWTCNAIISFRIRIDYFFNILFPLSVRKRWQYQIPIVFQVAVRSAHEPGDLKMSSEDLVVSLTEKDSHSSYSSPNVVDEDLRKCQLKTHHLMCAVIGRY